MQTQEKRDSLLSKKLVQFNIKKTRNWDFGLRNESGQTDNKRLFQLKLKLSPKPKRREKGCFFLFTPLFPGTYIIISV